MILTNGETRQINFNRDYKLEIKFNKIIKSILGNQFIKKEKYLDLKEGTDFLIMEVQPFRVAVRLRRFEFYKIPKFRTQFTIRWSRPSGIETEIHKIRKGVVDYFLYGFCDEDEKRIIQYFIADLNIFRLIDPEPIAIKFNNPPDSELAIYELIQFPQTFLIKTYNLHLD